MLSDNIKRYRKENNMSQDELAQKLDISRQSVSLWENGQATPTVDNIIALTKIFGVSADELLNGSTISKENESREKTPVNPDDKKKPKTVGIIIAVIIVLAVVLIIVLGTVNRNESKPVADPSVEAEATSIDTPEETESLEAVNSDDVKQITAQDAKTETPESVIYEEAEPIADQQPETKESTVISVREIESTEGAAEGKTFDLFQYCKDYAINKGRLNGDHCIYQQPSSLYGGYDDEYFSVSYWGDSDMVEFCLHCPLDDKQSINFYLRMRGGYDGKYEYVVSKYHRNDGTSIREARGYIDPATFSEKYPLSCDEYIGSRDGQDEFMEESRVGMCDLIKCLKQFVKVENMDCDFSDFGFKNF